MGEGAVAARLRNGVALPAFQRAMSKLSFGAMLGLVALGPAVAAAATGTLDTGALTPQTTGSRTAMEVMNTGASARTPGGETPPPAAVEATPREAGQHNGGPSGRNRPRQ